jgi:hypothetical protein
MSVRAEILEDIQRHVQLLQELETDDSNGAKNYRALVNALREIETICTESQSACRKRMGTRVGNCLVTARKVLELVGEEQ